MAVIMGSTVQRGEGIHRGGNTLVGRILIFVFMTWVIIATALPASVAVAQSQYLESIDLIYRTYSQITADTEGRLTGDFLDAMMRLDAGELKRHTIAGVYAPEAAGAPESEANGPYAAYHFGGAQLDTLPSGYDADIKGASVGYERWYHNTLYALNVASTKAEADFTGTGFDGRSEDQEMLSIGIHSMGIYYDDWTIRGRIAGFLIENDYDGTAGEASGASETAEYEGSGINAGAMIGRLFKLGSYGVVLPEIGGEYLYTQRDSFTTDAESVASSTSIRHFYDNQINGVASLRWTNNLRVLNIDLVPSIAAGVQVLLTDDLLSEEQTVGDTSTVIEKELEKVTKTVSASLLVHVTKHLQATLSYDGGFGDDADQHLLSLRVRFPF